MIADVAVVGGGAVGAALAALLARGRPGREGAVLLVERALPTGADAGPDLRVFALSRASSRILQAAGAWAALDARPGALSPYERMHVWPESGTPRGPGSLTFDAAELAEPDLGHIVGSGAVQRAALAAFRSAGGELLDAELRGLAFHADHVVLETGAGPRAARLVVGADGARSVVREQAGLRAERQDYGQLALVANLAPERPHESTAWQRFLGDGTLALLPLAGGEVSLVWSLLQAEAARLLELPPDAFEAEVEAASAGVLGRLGLRSARRSFPLARLSVPRYARERCVLVGDAAHIVHPLAGQGANLGLLDAAALAETLDAARRDGEDPGALRVLRRYERWRRGENEAMGRVFDLMNRFLAFGRDPVGAVAQQALGWVDRSGPLKRALIGRAMGVAGELPAAALTPRAGLSSLHR